MCHGDVRCETEENQANSSQHTATSILRVNTKPTKTCNAAKQGRSSHSHDICSAVKGHCRDNKDVAFTLLQSWGLCHGFDKVWGTHAYNQFYNFEYSYLRTQ